MKPHIMAIIEAEYGTTIRKAARRYSPKGTDPKDTYSEILIAVHDRVKSGRVDIANIPAMNNTIRQRAIDHCRREVRQAERYTSAGDSWNPESLSVSSSPVTYATRVRELKRQIIKALPPIDAVLVCEMVFPSTETQTFVKRHPFRRSHGSDRSCRGVVRSWHIAELYGVTTARVSEAMDAAREKIEEIIA